MALRLRGQARLHWIVAASVVFYAFAGHWWFVIPMLVTTTIDYGVAIAIQRESRPRRRAWLRGLSQPLQGGLAHRFLATLAHDPILVAPRLCSPRREPVLGRTPSLQSHCDQSPTARSPAGIGS
jgi:hypothetical protein